MEFLALIIGYLAYKVGAWRTKCIATQKSGIEFCAPLWRDYYPTSNFITWLFSVLLNLSFGFLMAYPKNEISTIMICSLFIYGIGFWGGIREFKKTKI